MKTSSATISMARTTRAERSVVSMPSVFSAVTRTSQPVIHTHAGTAGTSDDPKMPAIMKLTTGIIT